MDNAESKSVFINSILELVKEPMEKRREEQQWRNQLVAVKTREGANSHHVTDGVMEMTWVPSPTAHHDDDGGGDGGGFSDVYGGKCKKTKINEVERFS
ncbi:hypothetical protein Clacol_004658 [Clathrus columnatus]|uniref:Uncharacterized protein n=1 Tax=Clathrus columnatus TaxID=1419009 RepID=A0AAV5A9P7_9AGAM|nr:hypothetical protein Clacol_004658 [Clathrus columnatus]